MKATILFLLCSFLFTPSSIYEFRVLSVDERTHIDFSEFRGKKILIVNTASNSPYTYQLQQMQQLYNAYKEKLVVVGFPAGDDFGNQELKTNKDIMYFCMDTYSITFPMTQKVTVLGSQRSPVFEYLIHEAKNLGYNDPVITWNFTKFLLDEKGKLIRVFSPEITPLSTEVTSYLNNSRFAGL